MVNGKQQYKSFYFSEKEYPTEASVKKALQQTFILTNEKTERVKVDALFGVIIALYRTKHLYTLEHSTQQTKRTGDPWSASMLLQKGLKPVAEELGLGRITWHTLRHACRTWLDSGKAQVGVQKDLLRLYRICGGHSTPAVNRDSLARPLTIIVYLQEIRSNYQ